MARQRKTPPGVDPKLLIKDAAKLLPEPSRRLFLRGAASLGALAVLSGCDIVDGETSEYALRVISTFNDRVQALLFNPNTLAPEYPASMITRPLQPSTQTSCFRPATSCWNSLRRTGTRHFWRLGRRR